MRRLTRSIRWGRLVVVNAGARNGGRRSHSCPRQSDKDTISHFDDAEHDQETMSAGTVLGQSDQ